MDLPNPGIEPASPTSPTLAGRLFITLFLGGGGDGGSCAQTIVKIVLIQGL